MLKCAQSVLTRARILGCMSDTWLDMPEQRREQIMAQFRQRVAARFPFVDADDLGDDELVRLLLLSRPDRDDDSRR